MTVLRNLLAGLPSALHEETTDVLLTHRGLRIERIVSTGQTSPEGFWYDQPQSEWVLLLTGAACLQREGHSDLELVPGSCVNLPAHQRHRVKWTDPNQPTVWVAIHYE